MTDGNDVTRRLDRMDRELSDIAVRIRTVETVDSPEQRRILHRIDDISNRVDVMRAFDTNTKLDNLRQDVQEIRDDMKATRLLIRSTLITAASGIALGLINFVVYRAAHG